MITVIGSLNYDFVTYTDKVPHAGETVLANAFETHLGGKGLNEALACARLRSSEQIPVRMVGNVGSDLFGSELKQALVVAGVDVSHVSTLDGVSSGLATILIEASGENRILIVAGANGRLKPSADDYERIFPSDATATPHFVVLQNEYPYTFESVRWLKTHRLDINIAYNPSPFRAELITAENLAMIDLLILNEGEALEITEALLGGAPSSSGTDYFSSVASRLQKMLCQANCSTVVVTLGSKGSVFADKFSHDVLFAPAVKVEHVVDTTGAGDTFFGALVVQLTSGTTVKDAILFATVASSLSIQKKGAAESIPKYEEMQVAGR